MSKRLVAIVLVILVFTGGAIFLMESSLNVKNATGVVVRLPSNGQQLWGLLW